MTKTAAIALLSLCSVCRSEDYLGTIMMHDGQSVMPNLAVPSPDEVAEAKEMAESSASGAASLRADADALEARTAALEASAAGLEGAAIVYGSCVSFGSVSVEAPTNATARILGFNFTSNVAETVYIDIYTWFSEPPAGLPSVDHSVTLADAESEGWAELDDLGTVLTTYEAGGTTYECYRSSVAVPDADLSGFFRIRGEAQQTVIGQVLVVYGGLTINGVAGSTTNVAGIGQFIGGLLVAPLEGGE